MTARRRAPEGPLQGGEIIVFARDPLANVLGSPGYWSRRLLETILTQLETIIAKDTTIDELRETIAAEKATSSRLREDLRLARLGGVQGRLFGGGAP